MCLDTVDKVTKTKKYAYKVCLVNTFGRTALYGHDPRNKAGRERFHDTDWNTAQRQVDVESYSQSYTLYPSGFHSFASKAAAQDYVSRWETEQWEPEQQVFRVELRDIVASGKQAVAIHGSLRCTLRQVYVSRSFRFVGDKS